MPHSFNILYQRNKNNKNKTYTFTNTRLIKYFIIFRSSVCSRKCITNAAWRCLLIPMTICMLMRSRDLVLHYHSYPRLSHGKQIAYQQHTALGQKRTRRQTEHSIRIHVWRVSFVHSSPRISLQILYFLSAHFYFFFGCFSTNMCGVTCTVGMYTEHKQVNWFFFLARTFFPIFFRWKTNRQFDLIANYCKFMQPFSFMNKYNTTFYLYLYAVCVCVRGGCDWHWKRCSDAAQLVRIYQRQRVESIIVVKCIVGRKINGGRSRANGKFI